MRLLDFLKCKCYRYYKNIGFICYTGPFGIDAFLHSQKSQAKILFSLLSYLSIVFLPPVMIIQGYYLHENWQFGSFVYHPILYFYPEQKTVAFIIGLIFDTWFIFYIWGSFFMALQINLCFMLTVKTTIIKMMELASRKQLSQKRLLQQMEIYNQLRILTRCYYNVFGKRFVPGVKLLLGVMLVQSVFIAVRLAGKGGWMVFVFGVSGGVCIISVRAWPSKNIFSVKMS